MLPKVLIYILLFKSGTAVNFTWQFQSSRIQNVKWKQYTEIHAVMD